MEVYKMKIWWNLQTLKALDKILKIFDEDIEPPLKNEKLKPKPISEKYKSQETLNNILMKPFDWSTVPDKDNSHLIGNSTQVTLGCC